MSIVEVDQNQIDAVFDGMLTSNNQPADITGATAVHFLLHNEDGVPILDQTGVVVAVHPAHVTYTSVAGDLAVLGANRQQWRVDYAASPPEFYPDEPNTVIVRPAAMTPLGPRSTPDSWITWADVEQVGTPASLSAEQQDIVLESASEIMWQLSGRQFGFWTLTARPIPFCGHYASWAPAWWGYPGWAAPSARSWQPCSCSYYPFVHLGRAPIAAVGAVYIDGQLVDPSLYRVDEDNYLARLDSTGWPVCSDLAAPSGAPGVFEVTWTYGVAVPTAGKTAAALLALRFSFEVAEDEACAIPVNASNVTAEGVTVRLDTSAMAEMGRTGMLIPDMWLESLGIKNANQLGGGFDPGARKEFWRVGT